MKNNKKVLIVTYYWPPSGGGGVQRWVKFVKYLEQFGWTPTVFIPDNPEYPIIDESLLNDVSENLEIVRCPIWEPYKLYRLISRDKDKTVSTGFISGTKKDSFIKKQMRWIRGNFFFPDARAKWIKPASRKIIQLLNDHSFDALVTTGPPMSLHVIGRKVKEKTNISWVADFRDPWANMDNEELFNFSKKIRKKHEDAELQTLQTADKVITTSWVLAEYYEKLSSRKIDVIPNGFDTVDFEDVIMDQSYPENAFVIGHYGTFGGDRDAQGFWKVLKELTEEIPGFKDQLVLELVGPTDQQIIENIKESGLSENLKHIPYVNHNKVVAKMKRASLLLIILNQNKNQEYRIPGKIFEYLAAGKPILGIGSTTSDCAQLIRKTRAGEMLNYGDEQRLKAAVQNYYEEVNDPTNATTSNDTIDDARLAYSREKLTAQLADLLNQL